MLFRSNWKHWSNQLFCRELNLTVPTSAFNRTDKLSFIETVSQVALQFDLKNKSVWGVSVCVRGKGEGEGGMSVCECVRANARVRVLD